MQLFLGLTGVHRAAPGLGFWVPAAALWALSLVGFWGILGRDQRRLTILQVERGWDPDGSDRGRETRGSQGSRSLLHCPAPKAVGAERRPPRCCSLVPTRRCPRLPHPHPEAAERLLPPCSPGPAAALAHP